MTNITSFTNSNGSLNFRGFYRKYKMKFSNFSIERNPIIGRWCRIFPSNDFQPNIHIRFLLIKIKSAKIKYLNAQSPYAEDKCCITGNVVAVDCEGKS